jgi:hypothetical protein
MSEVVPPVLIFEGLDLAFYGAVAKAQVELEAIDVRDGIYTGYDSEGRLLTLETQGEDVIISAAESESRHFEELKEKMLTYLWAIGDPAGTNPNLDFPELLAACNHR